MTQIGLEALKLQETNRSNLANEKLKGQDIDLRGKELTETQRANLANEKIKRGNLDESIRSNKAQEKETNRSNVAREKETARSNKAQESETKRSNIARETETKRSNLAQEKETHRTNTKNESIKLSQLAETTRSNKSKEAQDRYEFNFSNLPPSFARDLSMQLFNTGEGDKRGVTYDTTLFDRLVANAWNTLGDLFTIKLG